MANVHDLLALPTLSPFQLSFFHYFIKSMSCMIALSFFNTSASTYYNSKWLNDLPLLMIKYKPLILKKQVS